MVKKLKQILLIIVALLLITGCRDQLDEEEYVDTSSNSSTSFTQLDSESEIKAESLQENEYILQNIDLSPIDTQAPFCWPNLQAR
ncbi:hypothetical protein [Paenibacillus tundrae]|uniref:PBP1b-binding outer membrane lipoprotein LpoB n=1 Tax=Paenibacillus tundrae TaxID=528187 RepID=A0ABT9WHF4_9BACL|nr:hypothetical protein [Paenibacillus tundrae]MDQ0172260.1 PBP1b-binding outer membrane lipoprotein LpoB [Paenibacillus tundrae]